MQYQETKAGIWIPGSAVKRKYSAHVVDYELLRNAYYGTGGFSNGTYLAKHKRESPEKYDNRRALAYYLNYTASTVNSHVDPVFRKEVKRDWGGSDALFELFLKNADATGNDLQSVSRRAALGSKLYGVNFVVVDNAREQPASKEDAIQNRVCPYTVVVEPQRVIDYLLDTYGRLKMFSYREDKANESGYNIRIWTQNAWSLQSDTGAVLDSGGHHLGRVPVVVWQSRELDPANILPPSEFYSIAQTNLAIYQLCSWLTEILQNQAFSILVYPSLDETVFQTGVSNALGFNGAESRHAPSFIAPDAAPAEMLQGQIDRLIQEIYRMANLTLVTGVKEAKSGAAKAWDFERTNQTLADFAANCEAAEREIVELWKLWTGANIEYLVEYPRDFAILDVAEELVNAQAAIDMQLGTTILIEIAKRVLAAYLPSIEPDVFDAIIKEIEAKGTDTLMSQTETPAGAANIGQLGDVIRKLLQAPSIDPQLKAQAEQLLNASGLA